MKFDVHPKSWTTNLTLWGAFLSGKHYKFDFKIKIVQEYLNGTQGYHALTKAYGLSSTSILRRWVDQYLKYVSKGLDKKLKNR